MKRFVWVALVWLLGVGWAEEEIWYYYNSSTMSMDPDVLDFTPSANDMLCAALLETTGAPADGTTVSDLSLPSFCSPTPPVVVWGADPDSGDTVYAALLVVEFWGQYSAGNQKTGVDRLIDSIKQSLGFRVGVSGDLDQVDAQFLPPFTTPPISSPAIDTGWRRWQSSQDLSLLDPQVGDVQNYPRRYYVCRVLYGTSCWSAVFTWALPVRLVVHGGERGSHQLTLEPVEFVEKTAATLGVYGGELVRPRVEPLPLLQK